nr:hypothetical protein [uncultured Draconibacterium sp.]
MRTSELPIEQGLTVVGFFITAYEDYIAARQLLINDLLIQGCILANTSIEKYFKGMKAILGEEVPRHHDITVNKFKNTIKNKFGRLYQLINFDFIKLLAKSYKLRYFDEIDDDFNISIVKAKTLAELDYLVSEIESSFNFRYSSQTNGTRKYTEDMASKNPLLWNYNYYLNKTDKTHFIERPDKVYEFRKLSNGQIMEIHYVTDQIINDGKFIYEAIKPKMDDPKSFTLCFAPMNEK